VLAAPSAMEQLTRNEQVSGSSPLVGSLFCRTLGVEHSRKWAARGQVHHPLDGEMLCYN
jgi:hypothetical protein